MGWSENGVPSVSLIGTGNNYVKSFHGSKLPVMIHFLLDAVFVKNFLDALMSRKQRVMEGCGCLVM